MHKIFLEGSLDSVRFVQKNGKIYMVFKADISDAEERNMVSKTDFSDAKERGADLIRKCWLHQHSWTDHSLF